MFEIVSTAYLPWWVDRS